jgi:hypothetical protein
MRLAMGSDSRTNLRRALIIIPGTVNYFYNLSGHRIAEALEELGFAVDVKTLPECSNLEYDLCILSNISEILHAFGDEAGGLAEISAVGSRCQAMASVAIDSVLTPWYHRIRGFSARAGAGLILDLGLHDQGALLDPEARANYRFVFSGLTPSEVRRLDRLDEDDDERPIPWAFIGHATPRRAALVDHLIQRVDPTGFVYMPEAAPYTEKGSPHLNQEQFERVLARTRYQVWCSHHSYFYMEPERFRSSLLTGGVPVKIVESRRDVPKTAPLGYLIMEPGEVEGRLIAGVFPRLRRRFWQDWRGFPSLSQEIARVLRDAGIDTQSNPARAA